MPTSEVDVKRNASNSDVAVEEPPSKKARLEDYSETRGKDGPVRGRGIAPIKAEYDINLRVSYREH